MTYITAGFISSVFRQVLIRELGRYWSQLAAAMGLPRTYIDDIQYKEISLSMKIDYFLMEYQFPAFKNDEETTEFLVEALERACLPNIAAVVKRNLQEGTQISSCSFVIVQ